MKKIRTYFVVGLISLLALSLSGCNKASTDANGLIVGLDDSFAPMGFRDSNGEIVGFDVDLAKEVGKRLNRKITFQPIDWSMKEAELNGGNIDFIWNGYTITEERKEKVNFSTPYLNNRQVIVTLVNSNINTKTDLKDKNIAAQNESSAVTAMEKESELYSSFNGGKAITYEDNNQALMDLENGRVDAVVADEILVRYYINLKGQEKFKILNDDFGKEEYGVGMRKEDSSLLEDLNKELKAMKEDGTMKTISEKWFGEDITD